MKYRYSINNNQEKVACTHLGGDGCDGDGCYTII